MFCKSLFVVALSGLFLASSASAQTLPTSASEADIDYVENQYENSGLEVDAPANTQSFGIDLDAEALLSVVYGDLLIENGQPYTTAQVSELPQIYVTPETGSTDFNASSVFTLVLADASAVGGPDPEGIYRHYLANNVTLAPAIGTNNSTMQLLLEQATTITIYAGPGPLPNSGIHRYGWLLFEQPASFDAPPTPNTETGPGHFEGGLTTYVEQARLGDLVAASFFTVAAEGTPSFSAGTTVPATSPSSVMSATSTGAVNAASRSASASASARSASATSGTTGLKAGAGLIAASLAGLAML